MRLVLALAAALAATPLAHGAQVIEQLLAVVNGKTIALSDLVRHRILFAPELSGEPLLQRMIDHLIVLDEAARFEIEPPDPGQVREAVSRLERSFDSPAQWQATLRLLGLEPADIERLVTEQLRLESYLVQRVDLFIFVSPAEVEDVYENDSERFHGQSLSAVEREIERELLKGKITEKRRDYVGQIRSRATIRQLAEPPDDLPSRP